MPNETSGFGKSRTIHHRRAENVTVSASQKDGVRKFSLTMAGGKIVELSEREHFLWTLLDGRASFSGLRQSYSERFDEKLTLRHLSSFIRRGVQLGLVVGDAEAAGAPNMAAGRGGGQSGQPDHRRAQRSGRAHSTIFGSEPWTVILGDPTGLFSILAVLFGPLRYFKWLVFPLAVLAAMVLLKNLPQFESDWTKITRSIPWWPFLYCYEHFLNLVARVTEGTIIQANGGAVRYFGIRFFMGVVLRGFIDEHDARKMPESVRLWSKAGVLLIRLFLFAAAAFIWITIRPSHPATAEAALFVSVLSFLLFCINACPFIPAEGYELLSAFIKQHQLVIRAFRFLGFRMRGRDAPAAMGSGERAGLVLFAVGTFIATSYVLVSILQDMGGFLTGTLHGLGYLLMATVIVCAVIYIRQALAFNWKAASAKKEMAAGRRRAVP